MLSSISREDIRLVYTFTKDLGQGQFGSVRIAHKTVNPGLNFAVKSIKREQIESSLEDEAELRQELMILRSVDHPNIVKLHEVYLDHKYLHIVTELLEGGPISPELTIGNRFNEADTARIVRQTLQALSYLHELKIVHRDIKTENILFCQDKVTVKLIDFGFAKFCRHKPMLTESRGTQLYMSPEVIDQKYDKSCDLWAVGVLTYFLLSGNFPFDGNSLEQKMYGEFDVKSEFWQGVSPYAIDFIKGLI